MVLVQQPDDCYSENYWYLVLLRRLWYFNEAMVANGCGLGRSPAFKRGPIVATKCAFLIRRQCAKPNEVQQEIRYLDRILGSSTTTNPAQT